MTHVAVFLAGLWDNAAKLSRQITVEGTHRRSSALAFRRLGTTRSASGRNGACSAQETPEISRESPNNIPVALLNSKNRSPPGPPGTGSGVQVIRRGHRTGTRLVFSGADQFRDLSNVAEIMKRPLVQHLGERDLAELPV
jgi:hypothetical protein